MFYYFYRFLLSNCVCQLQISLWWWWWWSFRKIKIPNTFQSHQCEEVVNQGLYSRAWADSAVNEFDKECTDYFGDQDTRLNMLSRCLKMKATFVRYNTTTLPSSAHVELFSTVGQIIVLNRNCPCDSTFEKLLLLKANSHLLRNWTGHWIFNYSRSH